MADNFTFKDASGTNRTARAKDNSTVHLPATVLADELGNFIAADDAAAAGPIFPLAGLYQLTVDEVNDGDIGRARMTARRVLRTMPNDFRNVWASSASVASAGDIEVSTTSSASGYAAPTTAFFNGADGDFDTSVRYIRVPMFNFSECNVLISNALGVNITLTARTYFTGINVMNIYVEAALANGQYMLTPHAAGTGATNVKTIPAMMGAIEYLVFSIQPASDPSGGNIAISVNRK